MKASASALAASCLFAISLGGATSAGADTATGGTYVTTLPSGAEVWFDGTYVGRSPLLVDGVAEGRHAIALLKTGWSAQDTTVTVVRGTFVMSSSRLVPAKRSGPGDTGTTGTLAVRDAPSGAEVWLDGAPLVPLPSRGVTVPAGAHEIAVKTGRGRTARTVTVYPDMTTDVILRETPGRRERSAVIAPAEDYLPTNAFIIEGRRIVVRYAGHVVVARFGETTFRVDGAAADYDSAPESIGGKLYLPLALLEKLSGDVSKDR
ncbi:MAG: hypothetical protein NVSMB19_11450 [Vulcanimicrobiaceae bacterium]